MIGMFGTAKSRFQKKGFGASYGNLVRVSFFSVASMLVMLIIILHSLGCH